MTSWPASGASPGPAASVTPGRSTRPRPVCSCSASAARPGSSPRSRPDEDVRGGGPPRRHDVERRPRRRGPRHDLRRASRGGTVCGALGAFQGEHRPGPADGVGDPHRRRAAARPRPTRRGRRPARAARPHREHRPRPLHAGGDGGGRASSSRARPAPTSAASRATSGSGSASVARWPRCAGSRTGRSSSRRPSRSTRSRRTPTLLRSSLLARSMRSGAPSRWSRSRTRPCGARWRPGAAGAARPHARRDADDALVADEVLLAVVGPGQDGPQHLVWARSRTSPG
jgi:hypothetical protein